MELRDGVKVVVPFVRDKTNCPEAQFFYFFSESAEVGQSYKTRLLFPASVISPKER